VVSALTSPASTAAAKIIDVMVLVTEPISYSVSEPAPKMRITVHTVFDVHDADPVANTGGSYQRLDPFDQLPITCRKPDSAREFRSRLIANSGVTIGVAAFR